jgi:hypothetical protein
MAIDILKSLRGNRAGWSAGDHFVNRKKGFVAGNPGKQFQLESPDHVVLYEDFLGLVGGVPARWAFTEGTDSGTSAGIITAAVNGEFVLTPGDSAGTIAADGAMLNSALNWKANQGELSFLAKVKLAAITSCSCFLGFTDTLSLEQPIESASSANTLTTTATDAVGWMFDTNMTADNWWMTGVATDVDATAQNSGYAPVADTYEWLGVDLTAAGVATFYRNGVQVGTSLTGAVTATVAMTPVFIVRPLSAAAGRLLTIDTVRVSALRT